MPLTPFLFDYLGQRGGEMICTLLIEIRSAIGSIEEICQVEGIDCLTIAPFGLSTEIGVSGQLNAPELVQAITHAERVILESGIPLGGAALTQDQTRVLAKRVTGCSGTPSTCWCSSSSSGTRPAGDQPDSPSPQ